MESMHITRLLICTFSFNIEVSRTRFHSSPNSASATKMALAAGGGASQSSFVVDYAAKFASPRLAFEYFQAFYTVSIKSK